MLIILEGPDCTAKSTLADRIAEVVKRAEPDADVTLFHRGPPSAHPLDEYVAPLLDYRPGTGRHVVCDRWHVGESVYPGLLNRHTDMTEDVRLYVEMFLRSRGALLVLCRAPDDFITECGVARGEPELIVETLIAAARLFDAYGARTALPLVVVDAVNDVLDAPDDDLSIAEKIVALANDEDWRTEYLNRFTTYVGPPRPHMLLLGDRRGPASTELTHYGQWPAFAPRPSTSGSWLLTTLQVRELTVPIDSLVLSNVGIANACDVDDPRELWDALGQPETVALGVNAHRALRNARVVYRRVPHPQWARRFKFNDRRGYLDALMRGATIHM